MLQTKDLIPLDTLSSSKGNQRKWLTKDNHYVKEQFFYQGKYWRDDLVEIIASNLGSQLGYDIVTQTSVQIEDSYTHKITYGMLSDNFCSEEEQFVSFARIFGWKNYEFDTSLSSDKRFKELMCRVYDFTGVDVTRYLINTVIVDYLVGNEDRHLHNLGLKYNTSTKQYSIAPILDCGLGLFEHDERYTGVKFSDCLKLMTCKPFSSDNQVIMDWVVKTFDVKFPKELSLIGCNIPSPKAGSYLRNRCMKLGIELRGVE